MQRPPPSSRKLEIEHALKLLFAELGEPNADQRDCMRRLAYAYGVDIFGGQVERAKALQAQNDQTAPGVGSAPLSSLFLTLTKKRVGQRAYRRVTLNSWQRLKARLDQGAVPLTRTKGPPQTNEAGPEEPGPSVRR
ncbi:MAG: hypothetical protein JWN04_2202 [Myxococcaceae bacterium]|nr:hypothetical protein [Myxococcaceae bacterium]